MRAEGEERQEEGDTKEDKGKHKRKKLEIDLSERYKENGKRGATGINSLTIVEGQELKVVFDGEGKKLAAVMKELEYRRSHKVDSRLNKSKDHPG